MSRILVLQGHPDANPAHFGHALAEAYADGASAAGHDVRTVTIAKLRFEVLRTREAWENDPPPPDIRRAQDDLVWAGHVALFFPLWMGTMPALVHGFFEQLLRPGFAVERDVRGRVGAPRLGGRSVRLVVTMGMPAPAYRWWFLGHGVRSLERSALGLVGLRPCRETFVGRVESLDTIGRELWFARLRELGRRAR